MKFFSYDVADDPCMSGDTLLVPSLSIGNVGQLAADLIVHSCRFRKVGYLESEHVLPMAANNCLAEGLTCNLEVFRDSAGRVTLVQQRAPVRTNRNAEFARSIVRWAQSRGISQLVLLSSVDSARRFAASQFSASADVLARFTGSGKVDLSAAEGWLPFEEGSYEVLVKSCSFTHYVKSLCVELGLEFTLLAVFCSTGVTIPHAMKLAAGAAAHCRLEGDGERITWTGPPSWEHLLQLCGAVRGPTPDYMM